MGSEAGEYTRLRGLRAEALVSTLCFSSPVYGTHVAWESVRKGNFSQDASSSKGRYFPLASALSDLHRCNGDGFHLLTSLGVLGGVQSTSSWKEVLYGKERIIMVTVQGEQICLPKKILQPNLH